MPVLASPPMKRRELLKAGAATIALSNAACGYILYPERKGQTHGRIDVGVLIIDLVWLLPGLLPGIVCLAVDFTTGCIYYGGGRGEVERPNEPLHAEVELDGATVAVGKNDGRGLSLQWQAPIDADAARQKGQLILRTGDGKIARATLCDLKA